MKTERFERGEVVQIRPEMPVIKGERVSKSAPSYIDAEFETLDAKKLEAVRREVSIIEHGIKMPSVIVVPVKEAPAKRRSFVELLFELLREWRTDRKE